MYIYALFSPFFLPFLNRTTLAIIEYWFDKEWTDDPQFSLLKLTSYVKTNRKSGRQPIANQVSFDDRMVHKKNEKKKNQSIRYNEISLRISFCGWNEKIWDFLFILSHHYI